MNAKGIVTGLLLLFVAASVVAWGIREFGPGPDPPTTSDNPMLPNGSSSPELPQAASAASDKVVAYYFHGNVRCKTCNTIEAYSHEAIQNGFADRLGDGRIEWRVVNYQEPRNKHFQEDFDLVAPSLVLVAVHEGKPADWKLLDEVWSLYDDKGAFVDYVQKGLSAFLEER
ncbi:MAG: nitrophenyl compound nitroreductase subunit ArsF family protein [Planctomycetota bacterium]